jgi:hypothetical protein
MASDPEPGSNPILIDRVSHFSFSGWLRLYPLMPILFVAATDSRREAITDGLFRPEVAA